MVSMPAEMFSQKYNIAAMISVCMQQICLYLFYEYVHLCKTVRYTGVGGRFSSCRVILFTDRNGIYCLVIVDVRPSDVSYYLRLAPYGLGDDVKFGGAGLITAMIGGSIFVPLHAMIIDSNISILGTFFPSIFRFIIPFVCFIIIVLRLSVRKQISLVLKASDDVHGDFTCVRPGSDDQQAEPLVKSAHIAGHRFVGCKVSIAYGWTIRHHLSHRSILSAFITLSLLADHPAYTYMRAGPCRRHSSCYCPVLALQCQPFRKFLSL